MLLNLESIYIVRKILKYGSVYRRCEIWLIKLSKSLGEGVKQI